MGEAAQAVIAEPFDRVGDAIHEVKTAFYGCHHAISDLVKADAVRCREPLGFLVAAITIEAIRTLSSLSQALSKPCRHPAKVRLGD